jgi:formylglycine-generating enzyme required for sulfatase activity
MKGMVGGAIIFLLGMVALGEEPPSWLADVVFIQGGPFRMGSPENTPGLAPTSREVASFWMGRHEVTVEEFARYVNKAGISNFASCLDLSLKNGHYFPRWFRAHRPVSGVSFTDAQNYCDWLSKQTGRPVRLPTEAEWEYAARGGIERARFPWGWGDPTGRACFKKRSFDRVGSYAPNPFGLYDMAGNVYEWCVADSESPPEQAVARGGSWAEQDARYLRVFHRAWFPETYRDADVGFRILIPFSESATPEEQKATIAGKTP